MVHVKLVLPIALEDIGLLPDDHVVLKRKRPMLLDAAALQPLLAAVDQHVVAHHVVLAIVLVEAAGLRADDEIIFGNDVGGPLVEVDAPSAVIE